MHCTVKRTGHRLKHVVLNGPKRALGLVLYRSLVRLTVTQFQFNVILTNIHDSSPMHHLCAGIGNPCFLVVIIWIKYDDISYTEISGVGRLRFIKCKHHPTYRSTTFVIITEFRHCQSVVYISRRLLVIKSVIPY